MWSGMISSCQCRRYKRCGFDSWVGKIPWRRKWQHPSILAWKTPWREEPGRLQSIGLQRVGHHWIHLALDKRKDINFELNCLESNAYFVLVRAPGGSRTPFWWFNCERKKVKVKSFTHVLLFVTLWTVAHQAPPSMGFSKQEYWSGLPFPSPGDLPDPGIEPGSPALQADALPSEPPGKPNCRDFCKIII